MIHNIGAVYWQCSQWGAKLAWGLANIAIGYLFRCRKVSGLIYVQAVYSVCVCDYKRTPSNAHTLRGHTAGSHHYLFLSLYPRTHHSRHTLPNTHTHTHIHTHMRRKKIKGVFISEGDWIRVWSDLRSVSLPLAKHGLQCVCVSDQYLVTDSSAPPCLRPWVPHTHTHTHTYTHTEK